MFPVLEFAILLFVLYLLSKGVTQNLSFLMHRALRSRKLSIYAIAFFLFPGTLIHELAHFLTAHLLFVPTRDMEFMPKLRGEEVKLGSVKIAKTDIFRRTLIGIAPLIVGLAIIFFTVWYVISIGKTQDVLYVGVVMLCIFLVGNTMFPSRKDLEGIWPLFISLVLFLLVLIFMIFWQHVPFASVERFFSPVTKYTSVGNTYLFVVVIADGIFVFALRLLQTLQRKSI